MITEAEKNRLVVGYKQTMKAFDKKQVQKLFLASDAGEQMIKHLEEACEKNGAEVFYISDMRSLGKMCGIRVGASCAAVLA